MKQALLEDTVIHADETTVQVLKEDGKAATSESRMDFPVPSPNLMCLTLSPSL